jgi:anti-sigma B factor antagonist
MPFSVEVTAGSPSVVLVSGELDVAAAPELKTCLAGLAHDDVALDLAAVTFMDSSGISVLIAAHRQSADLGRRFTLRSLSPAVAKVLKITGVDEVLTIEAAD